MVPLALARPSHSLQVFSSNGVLRKRNTLQGTLCTKTRVESRAVAFVSKVGSFDKTLWLVDHRYIDEISVLLFLVLSYNVNYLGLNVNDHLYPRVLDQCLCQYGSMNKKVVIIVLIIIRLK